MEGAERGDLLIVWAVLDAGALSRVAAEDGTGPMIMAVKSGNMEVVKAIIDAGGSTSECSKEGFAPLFQAIEKNPQKSSG